MNTAANIIKIPCPTERRIKQLNAISDRVLNGGQTAEQLAADCRVLLTSDMIAHQRIGKFMKAYRLPLLTGEVQTTRRLNDEEMASIGLTSRKQMVRPDIYADFTEAVADSADELRKLFFPGCLVVLAGLAIGYAAQWMWGAL